MNFDIQSQSRIQNEIPQISLKDAVEFIVDNRGKTAPTEPTGIALIATNCVNNKDLYPKKENLRFVSQDTYDNWFRSHPKPGDILLTNKGSQNGAICLVPDPVDFCIAQDMVALRADSEKISPPYLFAALRSDLVQKRIKALNVDAVIPHLKKTDFNKLLIPLPDRHTQDLIGEIYFILSNRIELLRETNTTLEAIAQTLFKSWFVDFDPVHAKQQGLEPEGMDSDTAALFPDSFEESELGLVPIGWRASTLDEISKVGIGKTPPRKEQHWFSENPNDVRWVSIRDMGISGAYISTTNEFLTAESIDRFNVRVVPDNTVMLSFKMTIGRIAISDGEMTTNEAIAHFKLNGTAPLPTEFIYLHLKQFDYSTLSSTSSIADAVNSKTVKSIPILIPAPGILIVFQDQILVIFQKIKIIEQQIKTLAILRDTLLPRLISGQLRLPDAKTFPEETAAC